MRITLAQWRSYDLPIDAGNGTDEDMGPDCRYCVTGMTTQTHQTVIAACDYHQGFVDGFDAARGGE